MVGIANIFDSAQLYPAAARHAVWRELLPIIAGIVIFVPLGAYVLFHIDPQLVRRSMGGFILVFAVILMSGWVYRGPRGAVPSAMVGALAGGITGASGVGGPPIAIYYLAPSHRDPAREHRYQHHGDGRDGPGIDRGGWRIFS